jgi:LysR family transcriptional regulator, glycine cleavage system transcriptional activator
MRLRRAMKRFSVQERKDSNESSECNVCEIGMPKKPFDLPPLNLIEGFEAAARQLSFTKAADELFLTQSAVSRKIKGLEDRLGVPLFERRPRSLALTQAGATLYRTVVDVLQRLDQTTRQIRGRTEARAFTLTTTPAFAALWLIPRLTGYTRHHPLVDVRISASTDLIDLERSGIELAIRYSGPIASADGKKLFGEDVMPVCAPGLLRDRARPLRQPSDLARHVLLHYDDPTRASPSLDWATWLHAEGIPSLKPVGALHFNQYDQVVLAALDGQGVALGRSPLLGRLIRARKLVTPFAPRQVAARGYYVIESRAGARNPDVQTFVGWIQSEANNDAQTTEMTLHDSRRKANPRKVGSRGA